MSEVSTAEIITFQLVHRSLYELQVVVVLGDYPGVAFHRADAAIAIIVALDLGQLDLCSVFKVSIPS